MRHAGRRRARQPFSALGARRMLAVTTLCCIWGLFCLLGPGAPLAAAGAAASGEQMQPDAAAAAQLLSMVNAQRAAAGVAPLSVDDRLGQAAVAHSLAMGRAGRVWHNVELATAAFHAALGIRIFGENVVGAPNGTVQAEGLFLASPRHRENLLDPRWAVAGFGVVRETDGYVWVTQDFGTPPGVTAVSAADRSTRPPLPGPMSTGAEQRQPEPTAAQRLVPLGAARVAPTAESAPAPGQHATVETGRSLSQARGATTGVPGDVAAGLVLVVAGAWLAEAGQRLRKRAAGRPPPG